MTKTVHVISRFFYPVYSGLELNTFRIYSHLAATGWEVIVHTTNSDHTGKKRFPSYEEIGGIKVNRYSKIKYFLLPFLSVINFNNRDFICLHGTSAIPFYFYYLKALLAKSLRQKTGRLIYTPHGILNLGLSGLPDKKIFLKTVIDRLVGVFLINKTVDLVRAVSDWEKRSLVNFGLSINLIKVVKNGLEPEAFMDSDSLASSEIRETVNKLGTYLVQLARIDSTKNQETAIRALNLLPVEVNLALVGQDQNKPYKRKVINLIKKLGLENRVHWLGVITGIDKYYLLKHALAMVHPSRLEGFCNALYEGMSQGIICITASGTAAEELIKNKTTGYLLDPDDYRGIAELVNNLLSGDLNKEVKQISTTCKSVTANKTWGKTGSQVARLYLSDYEQ